MASSSSSSKMATTVPAIQLTRAVLPRGPNIVKPEGPPHSVAPLAASARPSRSLKLRLSRLLQAGEQPGNVGEACLD